MLPSTQAYRESRASDSLPCGPLLWAVLRLFPAPPSTRLQPLL